MKPISEGGLGLKATAIPGIKTIRRRIRAYRAAAEESPRWNLFSSEPEDVALLTDVQAWLLADKFAPMTEKQADAVLRVRRAAPSLWRTHAHHVARMYLDQPDARPAIELFLGMRPWESDKNLRHWREVVGEGAVSHEPHLDALAHPIVIVARAPRKLVPRAAKSAAKRKDGHTASETT